MTDPDVRMKVALHELSRCVLCEGPIEYVMGSVRCRKCGVRGPFGATRPDQAKNWERMNLLLRVGKKVEREEEAKVQSELELRVAKLRGKSGPASGGPTSGRASMSGEAKTGKKGGAK